MKITKIERYQIELPLLQPFKTSYGELQKKAFDLYILHDELGNMGYGELTALTTPEYIEETLSEERAVIETYLLPLLWEQTITHPQEITVLFTKIQGHFMAKAALEMACWDLFAKRTKKPLKNLFRYETQEEVTVGISLGQQDLAQLMKTVDETVAQGYTRLKLKISPTYDVVPLRAIREKHPQLTLMADANSAYKTNDLDALKALDTLNLAMIEQPFDQRDFVQHAQLQQQLQTPICLDENIRTLADVQTAHALNSAQAINLKLPRVGGITEALRIVDYCQKHQLNVWLGGMYESGIGRAFNLHFASQTPFTFPGDISAANRYFAADIVEQPATLVQGKIAVPTATSGIGVTLAIDVIEEHLKKYHVFRA